MKQILLLCALIMVFDAHAQVIKRIADRTKRKVENVTGNKIDKAIDNAADGKNNKQDNNKNAEVSQGNDKNTNASSQTVSGAGTASLQAYSKYDFVPGEKVIAFENFDRTDIADFPTNWNTNATAEVVTLNNKEGKWLKISKEGIWHPEFITNLPQNFTLEYDIGVNNNWKAGPLALNIANFSTPEDYKHYYHYVRWRGVHAVHLDMKPKIVGDGWARIVAGKDGNHSINNDVNFRVWDNKENNFAHVAIWRQNQRLRVYINGEKIYDLPRAFEADGKYNAITFALPGGYADQDYFVLSNIRLASGAADTRNKLVTEGKFVTRGILFDVNSDKIKAESYGTLKDIANVLKENPAMKVKIVGHTDADGDDNSNLELSQKRAAAVKTALVSEFAINEDNLETNGKGETEPVDKNTTAEGKANNRRVEFIKI